jgi:beta-carotene hydroxylase
MSAKPSELNQSMQSRAPEGTASASAGRSAEGRVLCRATKRIKPKEVCRVVHRPGNAQLPPQYNPLPPRLNEIGVDLLKTSKRQRAISLSRPFLGIAIYAIAARFGLWWCTPLIVFLIFIAVVTVTHDVVHGTLGLNRRQTDWALFLTGAVLLESGHAYRITHLQHHRVFPREDDPEGDPARLSTLQAIIQGPLFLPRLWWWSFQRARRGRVWLLLEALTAVAISLAAIVLWRQAPAMLLYVVMVIIGSWTYPLLTVHLPHRHYGDTPLTQTHTLRGRLIPSLFLELTYHLEHHLYPQVPSHHLAELARRLDPYFRAAGVSPIQVP